MMFEIWGENYYIDVENIVDKCTTVLPLKKKDEDNKEDNDDIPDATIEINMFKYEVVKMCLDRVLNDFDDMDETDDKILKKFALPDMSVSFKLAFNTLIKYEIIIQDE